MSVTTPPSVDTLPPPPDPGDRSTFNTRAYPWSAALPTFSTQMQALATNVAANATDCEANAASADADAAAAAISAQTAVSSAGASVWVSGSTYSVGDVRYSPANQRIYRRTVAGAGTTDPSADPTNWALVSSDRPIVIVTGTSHTLYAGPLFVCTNVAAVTATLPAASGSGDSLAVLFTNGLYTNVLARASGTIMGSASDMTLDAGVGLALEVRDVASDWRIV